MGRLKEERDFLKEKKGACFCLDGHKIEYTKVFNILEERKLAYYLAVE